jgi:broad specificity phosphatase PhoE
MTAAPPLYILRHGETEWNATGRLQGHFDSALTATGRQQADDQRKILLSRDLGGFAVISSPQGRALETARIALSGVISPIETNPALGEIGIGAWAGANRSDLLAQTTAVDGFDLYELAPEGEGFAALEGRCRNFLQSLTGPSVLITHGITSRMLRVILTGRKRGDLRDIAGGQGVVFYLAKGNQERLELGA